MQRVLVIGISGAGKSTFARELAQRTGLPLIHLDREFWQPGWKITPEPEWRTKVAGLVAREAWIMDGGYSASLDLRLPRADTVIWFDYPRGRCLRRIAWRIATTYGRVRPDLGEGCPEKIDWEFFRWVWNYPGRSRPRVQAMLAKHLPARARVVVIKRDVDARRFLAGVGSHQATAGRA
jgi:adenylate kinase family enzyme